MNDHPLPGQRQRGVANVFLLSLVAAAIVALGFIITYQFVDPAPPERVVLATGAEGGAYQQFGKDYAAYLAANGIEVVLRETAGSAQNLALLRGDSDIDLAFVQSGLAEAGDQGQVMALGSLYFEPLLVFIRDDYPASAIRDLLNARLSVGEPGSGSRAIALKLLAANGIDENEANFVSVPADDVGNALRAGVIDVAFIVADPQSDMAMRLVMEPGISLIGIARADAYARRYPFLSSIDLPEGVLDLAANKPDRDTATVATTAMLVSRANLHPALVDLLLVAARDIHGSHGLLADRGEFPSPRYVDFQLSAEAERHFRRGPPFLMRYLPFWAATFIDRMWVMVFPLIGLAIPLFKLVIPAYRWQVRRRFLKLYAELESIDPNIVPIRDAADASNRKSRIDELEKLSAVTTVPREYKDAIYKLRRDIDLIRRRLAST